MTAGVVPKSFYAPPTRIETACLSGRIAGFWDRFGDRHPMLGPSVAGRDSILVNGNDYLCLAGDRRIAEARAKALLEGRDDVLMSGVFLRADSPPSRFEKAMAAWIGTETAVLCQSGYAANDGLVQTIADERTPVYVDFFAHWSLWQGVKSAGAPARPFLHNDVSSLAKQIRKNGPGVVLVDSVYSTSGDVAPLKEMAELCDAEGCMFVVDESHSLGVFGFQGRGLCAELGIADRVVVTASLSKAFVGRAGIVACPERLAYLFRYESNPAIFSSVVLNHEVDGFIETLEIIKAEDGRRERVLRNATTLRAALAAHGFDVATGPGHAQIVSVVCGTETNTADFRDATERRGVFGAVFYPPATPKKGALLRLSVHSGLTDEDVARVVAACVEGRAEVDHASWPKPRRRTDAA